MTILKPYIGKTSIDDISEIPDKACSACGRTMSKLKWDNNGRHHLYVCDSFGCVLWRRPQGTHIKEKIPKWLSEL